jgi:hypothetical protein
METRPISRSLSTTGMWRNRRVVISDILSRQYAELLAPKGRLQLHHVGKLLGAREARGQVEARIDVPPGEVDDLAVEGGSTLASSVEGPFEGAQRCIESIPGAVRGLASLCHSLLGKRPRALRDGGVETEMAELICRLAVSGAGLVRGSLGIVIHHSASWVKSQADTPDPLSAGGGGSADFSERGVHVLGTVVLPSAPRVRRASTRHVGLEEGHYYS